MEELGRGLTNKLYLDRTRGRIVRVFGSNTSEIIDRKKENLILKTLEKHNLCPKVYHVDELKRVEEYLDGCVELKNEDMLIDSILKRVIHQMGRLHEVDVPNLLRAPCLKPMMVKWLDLARLKYKDKAFEPCFEKGKELIERLDSLDPTNPLTKTVLSHNDLNPTNILLHNETIKFIDFEYGDYNMLGYELANFLNEIRIEYDEKNGICRDYSVKEFDKVVQRVCNYYFEEEIDTTLLSFFMDCSHFLWTCWAITKSDGQSDFDYDGYARYRMSKMS